MPPQPYVSRAGRFLIIHEESFEDIGLSSNVYATEHDGKYYLFDSGGHPDLLSYLEVVGIPGPYIGAVFLTHGHYDHVTGIKSLRNLEIPVFISGADRRLMEESLGSIESRDVSEGRRVLEDLHLEVLATPGHTKGSVCYYSPSESLLISGDTVFADGFLGRTDLPGGSSREMLESLKKLSKLDIQALLAGHGVCITMGGSEQIFNALSDASSVLRF